MPAMQLVMYATILCILGFGGKLISIGGMEVGELTGFLSYVLQVLNSLMMISNVFLMLTRSMASGKRILEVLDEKIDFGLISPYRVQVQYIRQIIKRNHFFIPLRKLITIHTVDGFQGQERDVILISLVRANSEGNIGFLNDLRRMNVAITRARMKLIILGDATTLTSHPFYKALYEYIREKGKIIEIQPETPDTAPFKQK